MNNCSCPSPLKWTMKSLDSEPICNSCGLEVNQERAKYEIEQKFQFLTAMVNRNKSIDRKRAILFSCCLISGIAFVLSIMGVLP